MSFQIGLKHQPCLVHNTGAKGVHVRGEWCEGVTYDFSVGVGTSIDSFAPNQFQEVGFSPSL